MQKKLLIWDFDGVIANTEDFWLKNRQYLLKSKLGIDWDLEKINRTLRGMSDKTKAQKLLEHHIEVDDSFWDEVNSLDVELMLNQKFERAAGIEKIFELPIKQCIATGGIFEKTMLKIKNAQIENYFPLKHIFTADMVQNGKPAPDLFLLACEKMGEKPQNAVVVEDSLVGLKAALAAGATPIAFLGFYHKNQEEYLSELKKLDIPYFCKNMTEVYQIILKLFEPNGIG